LGFLVQQWLLDVVVHVGGSALEGDADVLSNEGRRRRRGKSSMLANMYPYGLA